MGFNLTTIISILGIFIILLLIEFQFKLINSKLIPAIKRKLRPKSEILVRVHVEEKDIDAEARYMVVGEFANGDKKLLINRALTINEIDSDEVMQVIDAKSN